jgi:membrane protease YdiL (CAAX protease family)
MIPIICMTAAGAALAITSASEEKSLIIQAIAVAISSIAGLFIVKALNISYRDVGFCPLKSGSVRDALFLIPMVAVEAAQIALGPISVKDGRLFSVAVIFTLLVGLNEELYFRGLILQALRQIGTAKAIVISSAIFGVGHAATALSGASPQYVAAQIIFAFLFGFAAAEFKVITGSILPLIAWHFMHDLFGVIDGGIGDAVEGTAIIVLVAQIAILIAAAIIYWKKSASQK